MMLVLVDCPVCGMPDAVLVKYGRWGFYQGIDADCGCELTEAQIADAQGAAIPTLQAEYGYSGAPEYGYRD